MATPRDHAHAIWNWACGDKDHCQGCDDTTQAVAAALRDVRKAIAPALQIVREFRRHATLWPKRIDNAAKAIDAATRAPRRRKAGRKDGT